MQLEFTRTGPYEYSCTVHGPTDPYVAQYNTVQLYSRRKLAGIQRSLRKYTISRNRRNLQNRNSAAAEIAIRFGPKILLKCSVRKTGPKFRTTGLTTGINLRSTLNLYVQSLRPAHPQHAAGWCVSRRNSARGRTAAALGLGSHEQEGPAAPWRRRIRSSS
jgi:hypothetical protein